MVNYKCEKCFKDFKKKCHLLEHLNKKKPCQPPQNILRETHENLIKLEKNVKTKYDENIKIFEENNNIFNNLINNNENNNQNNLCCKFCGSVFNRRDNYKRHMDKFCKVKKLQDEEKENIFKILIAKDEENKKHINTLEESNKELKEYIKKLSDMNLDLNNKVNKLIEKVSVNNINKGIINNNVNNVNNVNNNIIITTDKLCNFGSEDLQTIDPKLFNNLFGKFGKHVFIECVKNIYNNEPKNKTLYISDLSREKCMAFENNNWNLISLQKAINTVEAQIRKYFKNNEKYYEEKLKDKKTKEKYDDQIKRWYKMYYQEYDENDKYEPPQDRLQEFHQVVNAGLTEFFYNIREDVKLNHENIKNKLIDNNILNKINYEPQKRGRGRPKRICLDEPDNSKTIKTTKSTKSTTTKSTTTKSNKNNKVELMEKTEKIELMEKTKKIPSKENIVNKDSELDSDDEYIPIGRHRKWGYEQ